MLRAMRRVLVALSLGVALSAAALLAWTMVLGSAQAGPPNTAMQAVAAPASVDDHRFCYNWDFYNNSQKDVNDLHVRLKGVTAVSEIYTGTLNPFDPPQGSGGYISASNVYSLNFSGAWVFDSDRVHIGLCTNAALLQLDTQNPPAFQWTLTGTAVPTLPLFTGLEWNWPSPAHLHLRVINGQPVSMTLLAANLLDADTGLALEDLVGDTVGTLPLALELLETPATIGPSADRVFDVNFVPHASPSPPDTAPLLATSHSYVLEVLMEPEDDPGNTVRLFSQALSPDFPLSTHLPIIRR